MPSATRNTNANSGNDESAPAKPNTSRNTTPQTPSVARNDSTTVSDQQHRRDQRAQQQHQDHEHDDQHHRDDHVAVALRGVLDVEVDRGEAADLRVGAGHRVGDRGAGPGSPGSAASESGAAGQGRVEPHQPVDDLRLRAGGRAPRRRAGERDDLRRRRATPRHGAPSPRRSARPGRGRRRAAGAGREVLAEHLLAGLRVGRRRRTTRSAGCRRPPAGPCRPRAPPARRAVSTQTARGRRPTSAATRAQMPVSSAGGEPYARPERPERRPAEQHQRRPAGTSASTSSAQAMPIPATGPRPRLEARSESSRQSRPRMTVPPLARIGSTEARHATRIASYRLSCRRSSSRKRATSSSA